MFLIERISIFITDKISLILELDKDKKEIIKYGAFNIIHTLYGFILIFLIALVFNVLFEAFIIQTIIYILRKSSGGAHATSPNRCAIMGVLIIIPVSILIKNLNIYISFDLFKILIIMSCIFVYYMIFRHAPVDTPTKPITNPEKKLIFKKKSLLFIHICVVITIILFFLFVEYGNFIAKKTIISIWAGLTWQAFTLSYFGHLIINGLDVLIKNTSKFVTGR